MPLTPADVANKLFGKQVRGYSMDEVDLFLDDVEAELTRLLTENAALAARAAAPPVAAPVAEAPAVVGQAAVPIAPNEPQEAALRTLLMAQRTADQAIAEAQAEADKLLADARERVTQIDAEINARSSKALSELQAQQAGLQARIDDLKAFEREYRLRLKAYLESQLKDLDARGGGSEGPGTGVPAAARTAAVGIMPEGVTAPPRPPAPPAPAPAPVAVTPPPPPARPAARPPVTAPVTPPVAEAATDFPQVLSPEWVELNEEPGVPQVAPSGPPREAAPHPTQPSLRAVPPLSVEPEPMGPFTVVPPPVQLEQVDEGPEPPTQP